MRLWVTATVIVAGFALAGCDQRTGRSAPAGSTERTGGVEGAAALRHDYSLQKSAGTVYPDPREAKDKENRPQMYADGCHLDLEETKSPPCVYGNPRRTTP